MTAGTGGQSELSKIPPQPFRAGLTFGGRPSGPWGTCSPVCWLFSTGVA